LRKALRTSLFHGTYSTRIARTRLDTESTSALQASSPQDPEVIRDLQFQGNGNIALFLSAYSKIADGCTLVQSNFQPLLSFLTIVPSLTHLHLVGSSFFGVTSTADEMSKLEKMPLYFRFPELGILLVYLRQSSVMTFTYRGAGEQRQMRWTRMNGSEEFDQDCWTL